MYESVGRGRSSSLVEVESGAVGPIPKRLTDKINRAMTVGVAITLVFVFGLGTWAAVTPLTGSVSAMGTVKVENNRKTIRRQEPGTIRKILVHNGDHVRQGQTLIEFDAMVPQTSATILGGAYDQLLAQRARFQAEVVNSPRITFPPELTSRSSDPQVAAAMATEKTLFDSRRNLISSQVQIAHQRQEELAQQITGVKGQVASADAQLQLNQDELDGVNTLYNSGYAPRTRLFALQRSAASLAGSRGSAVAEIARAQQAIGETRTQALATVQSRVAEAAAGISATNDKLMQLGPQLATAREQVQHTEVTAPVDGTVLNLTQFTEGAGVNQGEVLMDIVPSDAPLIIEVKVKANEAHSVRPGQKARVTLVGFNTQKTPAVQAVVIERAADQTLDPRTGQPYFTAELRIPESELRRLPPEVKLYPGAPVAVSLINGERSILSWLWSPMGDALSSSMHES